MSESPLVLFVDDCKPGDLKAQVDLLELYGFRVLTESDADRAVALIERGIDYDVLLCDRSMLQDTDDVVLRVASERYPRRLRVSFSGWDVKSPYAHAHLQKPVYDLPESIQNLLERHK